mgnify:CR=1 FL=1
MSKPKFKLFEAIRPISLFIAPTISTLLFFCSAIITEPPFDPEPFDSLPPIHSEPFDPEPPFNPY